MLREAAGPRSCKCGPSGGVGVGTELPSGAPRSPQLPTFHQLVDERAEVVGLLLPALAHLHHVSKVLAHVLEQLGTHFHFSLEESEQRILRS